MRILAIETSCDETALAIVEAEDTPPTTSFRILANNTLSQIDVHKQYGGVFPMLAKREHARVLVPLLIKTLQDAKLYQKTSRHVIESPLRAEFQEILERIAHQIRIMLLLFPHRRRRPVRIIVPREKHGRVVKLHQCAGQ